MIDAGIVLEKFRLRFGSAGAVYRAPGRVNLIGEHTDYNGGLVLPAAIGFSCWVAIAVRRDRKLVVHSENFAETQEVNLDSLSPRASKTWADYPFGAAWALQQAGYRLAGANLYISGDVPLGAGLSSSAAIEVATGYALLGAANVAIDRTKLALLCQRAENEFVGARTGIMDEFISCHGRAGHALVLDCRSLDFRQLPIPTNMNLIICNTMVKHEHSGSGYNTRRSECEEAVRRLSEFLPGIQTLRDVSLFQLQEHRRHLSDVLYRRSHHVITENERVRRTAEALEKGNVSPLRNLFEQSHKSLRDDYEVSCRELDVMVEISSRQPGVCGSRMTGGGFGGCTVNLVESANALEFKRAVSAAYSEATGIQPDIYICEASQGAEATILPAEDVPSISK
jgi:galactokinase